MKFAYLTLFGSLTPESIKLLEWEQSFLGLELVKSMLVGGGVGLSTNSFKQFKKGDTIAQFFGRFLVLPRSATDEVFHPQFMGCHNRLIELGPLLQPIVYQHHASLEECTQVSPFKLGSSVVRNGPIRISVQEERRMDANIAVRTKKAPLMELLIFKKIVSQIHKA